MISTESPETSKRGDSFSSSDVNIASGEADEGGGVGAAEGSACKTPLDGAMSAVP